MKLTQVPNLRTEDFPSEQQSWLSKLFVQINPFIQAVNQVFSQNIDYSSNIKSVTKSYDILAFQAFSFTWPFLDVDPVSVQVIKSTKGTAMTPTVLLVPWSFDTSTRLISVASMLEVTSSGVSALSGRYQFTVRATV